jgi:hypothetical protein
MGVFDRIAMLKIKKSLTSSNGYITACGADE